MAKLELAGIQNESAIIQQVRISVRPDELIDLICEIIAQLTHRANKGAWRESDVLVAPIHHISNKLLSF